MVSLRRTNSQQDLKYRATPLSSCSVNSTGSSYGGFAACATMGSLEGFVFGVILANRRHNVLSLFVAFVASAAARLAAALAIHN